MKSDNIKKGVERAPHRSLIKAVGYTDGEIDRPLVGIANSANKIIPGHAHLDGIAEAVRAGAILPASPAPRSGRNSMSRFFGRSTHTQRYC